MITTFGSCRVDGIKGNNNLNNDISYLHNTKEMIQMIKILKKEIVMEGRTIQYIMFSNRYFK